MGESATHHKQLNPTGADDRRLLDEIKNIPTEGNHFIVLHLEGSHDRYKDRLPKNYKGVNVEAHPEKVNDYDNSIRYTDEVLEQIFLYAQENLHLQAMIYGSDHGEDMEYFHGGSKFTFDMVRIPFWIYLSTDYQHQYPEMTYQLKNHENSIFTNDLVYDAVSGILRAPNSEYDDKYDITSSQYSITKDNAVTLHGKKAIKEDPDL